MPASTRTGTNQEGPTKDWTRTFCARGTKSEAGSDEDVGEVTFCGVLSGYSVT